MKKIAIVTSLIFCLAVFANAQRPWSATSVPGKMKAKNEASFKNKRAANHCGMKDFKKGGRDGKSFERKDRKEFRKGGFHKHKEFRKAK